MTSLKPLCVDLDGTLIDDDVTMIALREFIKIKKINFFRVIFWFMHGRAYLKHRLAAVINLDVKKLRYNDNLIEFIKKRKENGCLIFLATACNISYAKSVAEYLGLFDGVFASDRYINLRATAKANALSNEFGDKGFSYAGNSKDDVVVWSKSCEPILVNPTKTALRLMKNKHYMLIG